jgi:hypothetical protein
MEKDYLKMRWGDWISDDGFLSLPNTLVRHYEELNITDKELTFLMKILSHKNGYIINDEHLEPHKSTKTLQRYRRSLYKKGLLNYHIKKEYISDNGYKTQGIHYDTSSLIKKIETFFYEQKDKSDTGEVQSLDLEGTKLTTLYNTNYNTIYYSGGEPKAHTESNNKRNIEGRTDGLEPIYIEFIDTYKSIYLEEYGLDFLFDNKLYTLLTSINEVHLQTLTHYLQHWFPFIKHFNEHNNKTLDGSPYLLLKGGPLLNKFLTWAKEREEKLNSDFTVFENRERGTYLPPENTYVQKAIKKIYQLLSHKDLIHKKIEKYESKSRDYLNKVENILEWINKNYDSIYEDYDVESIRKKLINISLNSDKLDWSLNTLKNNFDRIKTKRMIDIDYYAFKTLSLIMKPFYSKDEWYELFNYDKDEYEYVLDSHYQYIDDINHIIKE